METLTIDNVVGYLLRKHLVTTEAVCEGDFLVEDRVRRNANFKVRARPGRGFILKQARMEEAQRSLRTEADLVHALALSPTFASCRHFLPTLRIVDEEADAAAYDLVEPATTLTRYFHNLGRSDFPLDGAQRAATLLARFHMAGDVAVAQGELSFVPDHPPGPLQYPEYMADYRAGRYGGPTRSYALALDEHPEILAGASDLLVAWKERPSLVHADARWENWLVTSGEAPDGGLDLRLIDFEFALRGDTAWDVARFHAEFLRYWRDYGHLRLYGSLREFAREDGVSPRRWRACSRAFWNAYCRARKLTRDEREALRARVAAYMPFAIALIARESLQRLPEIDDPGRTLVRLAAWSAQDPLPTLRTLFGVEPVRSVAA